MSNDPKSSSTETTSHTEKDSPKAKQTSVEMHETAKAKMQEASDLENSQGFRGKEVDPTDNDAYTVRGVTSGMKTPENDVATRDKVQKELKKRPEQLVGRHQKTAQAQADKENAQGYRGIATDKTPNENYSVVGVTSRKPTPETDF